MERLSDGGVFARAGPHAPDHRLGTQIDAATDSGRFAMLLLAAIFIPLMVVTMNRLVWRKLYRLAETRFKLRDKQESD
ncbi:MAG: hypothetical protein ABSG10_03025 [Terracidiphilus sp.]|jgi:ABC-type anion transport system duplicated permease subunit